MPSKTQKVLNYYGDVEAVVRTRLRVDIDIKGKPTKTKVLAALNAGPGDVEEGEGGLHDITDEEQFEVLEVLDLDLGEGTEYKEEAAE